MCGNRGAGWHYSTQEPDTQSAVRVKAIYRPHPNTKLTTSENGEHKARGYTTWKLTSENCTHLTGPPPVPSEVVTCSVLAMARGRACTLVLGHPTTEHEFIKYTSLRRPGPQSGSSMTHQIQTRTHVQSTTARASHTSERLTRIHCTRSLTGHRTLRAASPCQLEWLHGPPGMLPSRTNTVSAASVQSNHRYESTRANA